VSLPITTIITLAVLGLPLFCSLGGIGLVGLHHGGTPLSGALADVYALAGGKAVALSTIPLFTFAGYLMARAKTAERLVKFAEPLLGWIPGGLAILCVWTCAFFTVFTGASGVTIVALGGLLLPELERSRYPKRFSIEVVTGSGAIGLLFPPALPLIVYGIVFGLNAGQANIDFSIERFFAAGIVPGLLLLGILSIYCFVEGLRARVPRAPFFWWKPLTLFGLIPGGGALLGLLGAVIGRSVATKHGLGDQDIEWWFKFGLFLGVNLGAAIGIFIGGLLNSDFGKAAWALKWELPLPSFILGLLLFGLAVIPEVAALTALYVFVIEVFVYKDISLKRDLFAVTRESMTLVGAIMMKIMAATILTSFFVDAGVPDRLFAWLSQFVHSQAAFLLVLNVLLLLVGCLMDIFSAIVVVVPLIVPAAAQFHIDPYHLGVIFLLNLEIGYLLPPAGLNLFIAAFRFNRPITEIYRAVIPFILLMIVALLTVTYIPKLVVVPAASGPQIPKTQPAAEPTPP
jgi:TRAP-type C4-dicarboxylate transport system permease large subunit